MRILRCPSHPFAEGLTPSSFRPCDEYPRWRYTVGCAEEVGPHPNAGRSVAVRWGPCSCLDGKYYASICLPLSLTGISPPQLLHRCPGLLAHGEVSPSNLLLTSGNLVLEKTRAVLVGFGKVTQVERSELDTEVAVRLDLCHSNLGRLRPL